MRKLWTSVTGSAVVAGLLSLGLGNKEELDTNPVAEDDYSVGIDAGLDVVAMASTSSPFAVNKTSLSEPHIIPDREVVEPVPNIEVVSEEINDTAISRKVGMAIYFAIDEAIKKANADEKYSEQLIDLTNLEVDLANRFGVEIGNACYEDIDNCLDHRGNVSVKVPIPNDEKQSKVIQTVTGLDVAGSDHPKTDFINSCLVDVFKDMDGTKYAQATKDEAKFIIEPTQGATISINSPSSLSLDLMGEFRSIYSSSVDGRDLRVNLDGQLLSYAPHPALFTVSEFANRAVTPEEAVNPKVKQAYLSFKSAYENMTNEAFTCFSNNGVDVQIEHYPDYVRGVDFSASPK